MDEVFRFAGVGLAAKLELSLDYTLPELTRLADGELRVWETFMAMVSN